jgi:hypothetical protein
MRNAGVVDGMDGTLKALVRWIKMNEEVEDGADLPAKITRTLTERPLEAARIALDALRISIAGEMEDGAHYEAAVAFRELGESFLKLFIEPHEATDPALAADGCRALVSLLMMSWDAGVMDDRRVKYMVAKYQTSNAGSMRNSAPGWLVKGVPAIKELLAKKPDCSPWGTAGAVVKALGVTVVERDTARKYLKKHLATIKEVLANNPDAGPEDVATAIIETLGVNAPGQ